VTVDDDVLTISGERKSQFKDEQPNYIREERSFGTFSRSLRLPKGVRTDTINATHDHGVLTIELPKEKPYCQPTTKSREIAIK